MPPRVWISGRSKDSAENLSEELADYVDQIYQGTENRLFKPGEMIGYD